MGFLSDLVDALKGRKVASKLMDAACVGDPATVRNIIASADVRKLHPANRADLLAVGLFEAVFGGHVDIVRLLLDEGADVDRPHSGTHDTALNVACFKGHDAIVDLLIDFGADVNIPSGNGMTPLMFAAGECSKRVVLHLLEAGADPKVQTQGVTAAEVAEFTHRSDIARLLRGASVDAARYVAGSGI